MFPTEPLRSGTMGWEPRQKDLVLILARDLAARLATPMFVVDAQGTLVFYNEAAEQVLGRPFSEIGEMTADEWSAAFGPFEAEDGHEMTRRELPIGVALIERRPVHRALSMTDPDGGRHLIAVTALPLNTHPNEVVGAVALFWPHEDEAQEAPA